MVDFLSYLIHSQNDIGTLGSLPSHINRKLLKKWIEVTPKPQDNLIKRLLTVIGEQNECLISSQVKAKIAQQVREHYTEYPMK